MRQMSGQRLIIGISGASGAIYGVRLLQTAGELGIETHLVMTRSARVTLSQETDLTYDGVAAMASFCHAPRDIAAPISSGSFKTMGMIVAPCSMRTLSDIAYGTTGSLIARAADVVLKERRRLVLLARETPLHTGHLYNLLRASEAGAIIMPPVPAFYSMPQTIDDIVDHTVGRALDLFGLETGRVVRWEGMARTGEGT